MKKQTRKRAVILSLSLFLSMCMMAAIMPQGIIKADEQTPVSASPYEDVKKEHEHDEECGYGEATPEVACDHVHDENCGEMDEAENYPDCQHNHEDCSYQKAIEGQPCNVDQIIKDDTANLLPLMQTDQNTNEVMVIEFNMTNENQEPSMLTAISNAENGIDKTKITTIKVIGDATSITGDNWRNLLYLYRDNSDYKKLTLLNLSEMSNLTTIGNYDLFSATFNPKQLSTVFFPDTLKEIGYQTFFDCSNLNIDQLPSKLETIGHLAFSDCKSLSLTLLPDSIAYIDNSAFAGCTDLALTKLPSKLTQINASAFMGCSKLNINELPKSVTEIGDQAFNGTGITEIVIHDKITIIDSSAFRSCTNLSKITFEGIKSPIIEDEYVFDNIAQNGTISYPYNGTGYKWISDSSKFPNQSWKAESVLTISFNNNDTMETALNDLSLSVDDKAKIRTIKVTGDATSITENNWKDLLYLYRDNDENENDYKQLTTLDLSTMSDLTTIGNYDLHVATFKPKQLSTVLFPDTLKEIGHHTLYGCSNLDINQLPSELETIGDRAFYDCDSLFLKQLPDTITLIGNSAFAGCTDLALTKLPSKLTQINADAFVGCSNLNINELPKGVTKIGGQAFNGTGITEIVIHDKITIIDSSAFRSCTNLSKITFEGIQSPIIEDEYVFDNIASTGVIYYPEGGQGYEWIESMPQGWTKIEVKKPTPSGSGSHSHYYSKQWKSDEVNHWHECSCGKQKDVEAHEFSEWISIDEEHRERTCQICGYIQNETFKNRTFVDALTGVQLSGKMSESAVFTVNESPTHAVGLCSACDEIRSFMSEGKLIKAYELHVDGDTEGELTISIPVDPKYNGEIFAIYHYMDDAREDKQGMVINGRIEGTFNTLSPFAIVSMDEQKKEYANLKQGESMKIQPTDMNGTWTYDETLITITKNADGYTLTALKEGNTSAIYTSENHSMLVDVKIQSAGIPDTSEPLLMYALLCIFSVGSILMLQFIRRKTL